jgi:hypothetical protein
MTLYQQKGLLNGRGDMIVYGELDKMVMSVGVACFNVLALHWLRGLRERAETPVRVAGALTGTGTLESRLQVLTWNS